MVVQVDIIMGSVNSSKVKLLNLHQHLLAPSSFVRHRYTVVEISLLYFVVKQQLYKIQQTYDQTEVKDTQHWSKIINNCNLVEDLLQEKYKKQARNGLQSQYFQNGKEEVARYR